MSRAQTINFLGAVEGQGAARRLLQAAGDLVLDKRGVERAIIMRCPDGCGDILTVNLDSRAGKAWRLRSATDGLTIYPSIWRDDGCGAHFIVWRNRILWCDRHEDDALEWPDEHLGTAILQQLTNRPHEFQEAEDIAAEIDASPWEVIWECHRLYRAGKVEMAKRTRFKIRNGSKA